MKAMILAAGHGERMRPLTEHLPKPLLEVGGKPLIVYHIENLVRAGVRELVINHGRLGGLIAEYLGDGSRYGANIVYSAEGEQPLETGGGIFHALPMLGTQPFIVVNADVWIEFDFAELLRAQQCWAHLLLVPNPEHHPRGDFGIENGLLSVQAQPFYTYSGVGTYSAAMFSDCKPGRFPLAPLIRAAASQGQVSAEVFRGLWCDAGTPERLQHLDAVLKGRA
jgi:MurNAc alpha-1-phosphate uridylyltransferase